MSLRLAGRIIALLACVGVWSRPCIASTIIVPDDVPTVQLAIDTGADTVLIRGGEYPERPIIDHAVVLQGIGADQRPRLAGLQVFNSSFWANPPLLSVSAVAFSGPIEHTTLTDRPRLLRFEFSRCSLDSGFRQLAYNDVNDVSSVTIRNSTLGGGSACVLSSVSMEADTVAGGVIWESRDASILNCWFNGGNGTAIYLGRASRGELRNNRIEGYGKGVHLPEVETITLDRNSISGCETGVELGSGWGATLTGNTITDCGVGIVAGSTEFLDIRRNTILRATREGIAVEGVTFMEVEENTVGECGGPGVRLFETLNDPIVRSNTVFRNGGSGIDVHRANYPVTVEKNIGFENIGWGLLAQESAEIHLGCNDWFGNTLGAVAGVAPGVSDVNVEPSFCNVDSADLTLNSASPLVDWTGCGQIGALGVGCGVTPTMVQRFSAVRVHEGVRLVWQVASDAVNEIWLERSEGGEGRGWIRPAMERSYEGETVIELDRTANLDRTYWYRLVELEGSETMVIGSAIGVQAGVSPAFRLLEVGPNPGEGPVAIAFALRHAATIAIDVYDIQGRRVASPGRGSWPAGTHAVEWNGRTHQGETAPAGLYFLRYRYPGGQDRRTVIRTR